MEDQLPSEPTGRTIQSVANAFQILEILWERGGASIEELTGAIDLSRSTVHHYLTTLQNEGYVVEREKGVYDIGIRFLMLGGYARRQLPVFQHGRESIQKLAAETGETARLVVPRSGYGITVYQDTGDSVESCPTHVGRQETLHSTAAGKAILAAMDSEAIDRLVEARGLVEHTDGTITDAEALRTELEEISDRGIAFDDQEQFEGVRCVATAVRTAETVGAVSVLAPAERAGRERFRTEIPSVLKNISGVIQINTSYSRWD